MAIELTDTDFQEIMAQFKEQDLCLCQRSERVDRYRVPDDWGSGCGRIFHLRDGLTIQISNIYLKYPVGYIRQHEAMFPLVAKFYLSGALQVQTLDASDLNSDYQEMAGYHYLYHLPEHTEIEKYPSGEHFHTIEISIDPGYFHSFHWRELSLPTPLQKLLEGDRTQRFHQSLGRITPLIRALLKQILHCPYQGLIQQLYLESKALELLSTQFSIWRDAPPPSSFITLCAEDIEQLHRAKEIVLQCFQNPPSLIELAHQVGLNDRKLNQGFRQLFGTTVFGYLQDYRLQQAKNLLHDPDRTIASVATTVGYKSPEAFSTAFRRKFTISPKAYQLSQRM